MMWLNGQWRDVARIPADDRGFTLGDGLFETLHWREGRVLRQNLHEARMRASAQSLGLPDPLAGVDLSRLGQEMSEQLGVDDLSLRYSVSAGGGPRGLERPGRDELTRLLTGAERKAPPEALNLALSDIRRSGSSLICRHKTLNYIDNIAARRQARAQGADMALLLDTRGYLSGADSANLFWHVDGSWHTPAIDCGVLAGTVRAALIAAGDVQIGEYAPGELLRADAVVVTNAVMGIVPARQFMGQALQLEPGLVAALTARLD